MEGHASEGLADLAGRQVPSDISSAVMQSPPAKQSSHSLVPAKRFPAPAVPVGGSSMRPFLAAWNNGLWEAEENKLDMGREGLGLSRLRTGIPWGAGGCWGLATQAGNQGRRQETRAPRGDVYGRAQGTGR